MYLVFVDFSKNNLLLEQSGMESFYSLPVLNEKLIDQQLKNFSDISVEGAYLIDGTKDVHFSLFKVYSLTSTELYKSILLLQEDERILLIRNDVYFEFDLKFLEDVSTETVMIIKDKKELCIGAFSSVKNFKKFYCKENDLIKLFTDISRISDTEKNVCGYTKYLNTIKDYKSLLFDILNEKTAFKPPFIAEGIYTSGVIPKGDFSIIPPVYISGSAQIEAGAIIGPNSVVCDNNLISENSTVKNSVLLNRVFVSSDCYIEGALCCENASIKRNSAVFSGSVIGENALVGEDVVVENDSVIVKNVRFDNYVKSSLGKMKFYSFKNKFQGLTPDKAAILGSAVAKVFGKPKILVASDGEANSLSLKLAFLGGLIASGAECFDIGVTFKSHIFFSTLFCQCDYSAFFSGKHGGTNIEIYNSDNKHLSKSQCINLFDFCNKGSFAFVKTDDCKNVRQINGLRRMYIREITSMLQGDYNYNFTVRCKNKHLLKTVEEILNKISTDGNSDTKINIIMNESGTDIKVETDGEIYNSRDLKWILSFYKNSSFFSNCFYDGMYKSLAKYDAVFLFFTVLEILKRTNKNLHTLVNELPQFYILTKTAQSSLKSGETARLLGGFEFVRSREGHCDIELEKALVSIKYRDENNKVKITCASENLALSEELCNFFSRLLEAL